MSVSVCLYVCVCVCVCVTPYRTTKSKTINSCETYIWDKTSPGSSSLLCVINKLTHVCV